MSKTVPYDRAKPYNTLPTLPPLDEKVKDMEIMEKLVKASRALGKLDGIVKTLPNPQMLINTITLREAKDSSEIENIFTSHDELYEALAIETTQMPAAAREVLKYREALETGFEFMQESKTVDMHSILATYQAIQGTTKGIRPPTLSTTVRKSGSTMTSGNVI